MRVILTVADGPNAGTNFIFAEHDYFVVGRGAGAHFQPDKKDRYFSRFHFLIEINPPLCRLVDLGSRNGTWLNGQKVPSAELADGDKIRAGHTVLAVQVELDPEHTTASWAPGGSTVGLPGQRSPAGTGSVDIPGYRNMRELGRGGMGVVYLAVREADNSEVALKVIIPGGAATGKSIDLFLREASVLKRLSHPNIVAFRDMGSANGLLYFTMEYIAGTDAEHLLRERGPWSVRSAVRMIIDVLGALDYAHGLRFVHRDVKPANILLRRGDKGFAVKLADFGLARVYQASQLSGLSREGQYGGTPAYMPPEQVTNYRNAAPPADQFATAATLYQLLTGQYIHDFAGDGRQPILLVLEGEAIPIRDRRPELPEELAEVIHRALERDPARRFANCGELAEALRPFAE